MASENQHRYKDFFLKLYNEKIENTVTVKQSPNPTQCRHVNLLGRDASGQMRCGNLDAEQRHPAADDSVAVSHEQEAPAKQRFGL